MSHSAVGEEVGFLEGLGLEEGGESLLKAALSEAFGQDVSGVETRAASANEADELNARAFCEGSVVSFGPQVDPDNLGDHRSMATVAHEFAHALAPSSAPVHEVDRPGDQGEERANQAGAAFGSWMTNGMDGPAPSLTPATGGQARIHRETQDEGPLANEFRENELSGECADVDDPAGALMDAFVVDVAQLFDVWTAVRGGSDLTFDDGPLKSRYYRFQADWQSLDANIDRPERAFCLMPDARAELARRLSSGQIPNHLIEIRMFNPWVLQGYSDLLGIESGDLEHHYDLIVTFGVDGGGGELVVGGAQWATYQVLYSNSLGMSWSQSTTCLSVEGGVGVGTPISFNLKSSLGDTSFNAGRASTTRYYGPNFFDGGMIMEVGVEGTMGAGASLSSVIFTDGVQSIEFDTSGMAVKAGTDVVGNLNSTMGAGVCGHLTTAEGVSFGEQAPDVAPEPRDGQWVSLIEAAVYFGTGDAALGSQDEVTVERIVQAIQAHDLVSPGDAFRIAISGRASNRWRGTTGDQAPEELNTALAGERASVVRASLDSKLIGIASEFTPGVISDSRVLAQVGPSRGVDPDDNGQIDRSVVVAVYYNPCGVEGDLSHD